MASDATYTPTDGGLRNSLMTQVDMAKRAGRVPGFDWYPRYAHWLLRIPLAGLLLEYGLQKFPDAFLAPGAYGVPAVLFIMAAFAEVLGAVAIVAGGVIETWKPRRAWLRHAGDLTTRAGGFAAVSAVMGVIAFFYWGALTIGSIQVMALGLGAFFLIRGNGERRRRARAVA